MPPRSNLLLGTVLLLPLAILGCSDDPRPPATQPEVGVPLSNGRRLVETAAATQPVGNIPVNMVVNADHTYAVGTDIGFRQILWVVRLSDGKLSSKLEFPRLPFDLSNGLYYGLAISRAGDVFAAQGNHDSIAVLRLSADGLLTRVRTIATRKGDFPAGLTLDEHGHLFVANNDAASSADKTYDVPGSVAIYDADKGTEIGRFEFRDSFGGTPNFPLAIAVTRDGAKLYVASERDSAVYVLDTSRPDAPRLLSRLETGSHPIALLLDRAQSRLFVANAHSDTVSVVDAKTDRIVSTVLMRPEIARHLAGATPTGLALSPDESTLYVTLGDMNAVGVLDAAKGELLGYIPAGWYPMGVAVSADGKRLLVANAKGTTARNPNPPAGQDRTRSPVSLLEGNVLNITLPAREAVAESTERVLEADGLTPRRIRADNPLAWLGRSSGKIKHVIYVVKENRTYDQVLGDLPQGDGDPGRCLFGRAVTPNQHALAERFVLLDNFYDAGEVSGDGWTWSTQGHANEYVVRNVPYSYSDRGRSYDYEGQVNDYPTGGFPAAGPDGKPLSDDPRFRNGAAPVPDVGSAPGGHLWDLARKAGRTYRNYGFFLSDGVFDGKKTIIPDNYPSVLGLQPGGRDLASVSDVDFRRFDLNYADSEAREHFAKATGDAGFLRPLRAFGSHKALSRFSEWNAEFKQMLAAKPDGSSVPELMTVRFCDDHTMGANRNQHTPRSMVADNDYAVGQLVEAVSHSPIWQSTAIFVIEDDAQNGPDHVDAHRSTCYVISPWVKPHSVDHTFQNTVSVLKTMELLLGLPPMCQYDAIAEPIDDWDRAPTNAAPYGAILPDPAILREVNGANNPVKPVSPEQKSMIEESERMDFAHADRAPADRLNRIIWQTVRGPTSTMPPTPHGPTPLRKPPRDEDN